MKKITNWLALFLLVGTVFLIRPNSVQGQLNCKFLSNPTVASCGQGEFQEYPSRCQLSGYSYCCKQSSDCDTARTDMTSPLGNLQTIIKETEKKGSMNAELFSAHMVANFAGAFATGILGDITEEEAGSTSYKNNGLLGLMAHLNISLLTTPPVSGTEYLADLGKNFGIVKPAYAQGTGFEGLKNLLPIWKATRNASYVFFILVFLFTGLAIMFRVKLDPKTVITIQNAIPKLIIALILVTFSYAIAGLLLDLIYLLIYLGIAALGQTGWFNIAAEQKKFTHLSFFEIWGLIFGGGFRTVSTSLDEIIKGFFANVNILTLIPGLVASVLGFIVGIIFILLFSIVALFLTIKLFFSLLSCYINIIISVIIAPLQIMLGVIPGSQGGFGAWFRNLLANILVFPAVVLVLFLGWLLTTQRGPEWVPPTFFAAGGTPLTAILGLGMLMLVTKVPEMVKSAFKMKPEGYGAALAEPLQAAYRVGQAGYKAYQEKAPWEIQKRAEKEAKYKDIVRGYRTTEG